jgi:uncharacterized membrane protein YccC
MSKQRGSREHTCAILTHRTQALFSNHESRSYAKEERWIGRKRGNHILGYRLALAAHEVRSLCHFYDVRNAFNSRHRRYRHRRAPANPRIRHEKIAMRICDGLGESRVHAFQEPKQQECADDAQPSEDRTGRSSP